MNASGPTGGEIVRPSDGKHPHSVVFIACVGSRDDKVGRPYCSRICCMYTAKQAIMLKEHAPQTEAYVFYMDVRAGGRSYDEFVRRAQEVYGTHYLRGRVSRIYQARAIATSSWGTMPTSAAPVTVEADLVVLANGATSARGAVDLMQTLGISYDQYGFINEAHVKLRPVETNTAGIYLAGCSAGPKDIPDTVAQASAAAAKVCGLFARPFIETEPTVAEVDHAAVRGLSPVRGGLPVQRGDLHHPPRWPAGRADQPGRVQGLRPVRGRLPRPGHLPARLQ